MPWSLLLNPAVLTGIAFAIVMAWGGIQTMRLGAAQDRVEAVTARFDQFKSEVEAAGKAMQERAILQAKTDKRNKEASDAENKRLRANNDTLVKQLFSDRSGSSYAPAPGPTAKHPERACFQRTQFERALSGFVEGTGRLIEECDRTRIDLDTAKRWAGKLATKLGE